MMKRLFDILFSVIALVVFSIPMLIICMFIRFKEKHPIVFRQERIGLGKKPFEILKFQTMVDEVPTATGRILRRTGLDEILQFVNVLKGDMSIVGPRALTMADIKRLGWDDEHHSRRWSIKPGISGFAQIYGGQHRKLSWFWDCKYAENSNVLIDFGILCISFAMNVLGKRRVRRWVFRKSQLN